MWYLFNFFQIQCSVLSMFCRQFWCSIYKRTAGRRKSWRGVLRWPPDPREFLFRLPPLGELFLPRLKMSLVTAMLIYVYNKCYAIL